MDLNQTQTQLRKVVEKKKVKPLDENKKNLLEDIPIDEIPPEVVEALKTSTETTTENNESDGTNSDDEEMFNKPGKNEKNISKSSRETSRSIKKKQKEEEKSN
jgi:hypothetical protein